MKSADKKIAISNSIREKLEGIGLRDAVVMPNGVDLSLFRNSKENNNFNEAAIGYIGSLSYNKGLQNILNEIKSILAKHKKCNMLIVGKGELKEMLAQELVDFGDRVSFRGSVSYNDIAKLYNEIDIVIIPSIWQEPFSRVAIEAMAAGKPIIASNVGGLKDLVKKDFGILIDLGDNAGWGEAMDFLISKPIKRKLMGVNALKEAKKYDINIIAERMNEIYGKLK